MENIFLTAVQTISDHRVFLGTVALVAVYAVVFSVIASELGDAARELRDD